MLQNSLDLDAFDAGEPIEKLLDGRTTPDILERCFHRNSGIPEQPCTADSHIGSSRTSRRCSSERESRAHQFSTYDGGLIEPGLLLG
jgi:hypothetical protein